MRPLPMVSIELPAITVPANTRVALRVLRSGLPRDKLMPRSRTDHIHLSWYTGPRDHTAWLGRARTLRIPARRGEDLKLETHLVYNNKWFPIEGSSPSVIRPDRRDSVALEIPSSSLSAALQKARR